MVFLNQISRKQKQAYKMVALSRSTSNGLNPMNDGRIFKYSLTSLRRWSQILITTRCS